MLQIDENALFIVKMVSLSIFDLCILILILLSVQWVIYIYRDTNYAYHTWKYKMTQYTLDEWNEGKNFKHRFYKNILILVFLFLDIVMCLSFLPQTLLRNFDIGLPHHVGNCTLKNETWLYKYYNGGHSLWGLESIRMSLMVIETGIFEGILLYLIEVYTTTQFRSMKLRHIVIHVSINFSLGIIIFLLNLTQYTFLFGQTLFIIVFPIYSVLDVKYARRLSMVLGWKHQDIGYIYSRSNSILLNEGRVIHRYRQTIYPFLASLLLVSFGQVASVIFYVWADSIISNPCWFSQIYNIDVSPVNTTAAIINSEEFRFYWIIFDMAVGGFWLLTGIIFFTTIISLNVWHFSSSMYQEYQRRKLFKNRGITRQLIPSS